MKFAFFGSPKFAAIVLEKLIESGFVPSAVVCNPDRPVGRKKILTAPAVKQWIMEYGERNKGKVQVLQPEKLDSLLLTPYSFDFFVVAAYAQIIPKSVLALPRLGVIGVHPSLLPRHRGATPIQTAILEGDAETGTTLFLMDDKIDHGPVLAQRKCKTESKNYEELERELADLSGKLLVEILPDFTAGKIKPVLQNDAEATFTKKFRTQEGFVEEKALIAAESGEVEPRREIDRKIRALNPEPGAWTIRNGKRLKLLEAEIKEGKLVLKKIQVEGKKPQQK